MHLMLDVLIWATGHPVLTLLFLFVSAAVWLLALWAVSRDG